MTMPEERTRALVQTRQLLEELLSSEAWPSVPDELRRQARVLLRHYPEDMHMRMLHLHAPDWYGPVVPSRTPKEETD